MGTLTTSPTLRQEFAAAEARQQQPAPETRPVYIPARQRRRHARLVIPLNRQGRNGVVRIIDSGKVDEYFLDRLPAETGSAFHMEKRDYGTTISAYRVELSPQGDCCGCPGFTHYRHCRHVLSLRALHAAGKL